MYLGNIDIERMISQIQAAIDGEQLFLSAKAETAAAGIAGNAYYSDSTQSNSIVNHISLEGAVISDQLDLDNLVDHIVDRVVREIQDATSFLNRQRGIVTG